MIRFFRTAVLFAVMSVLSLVMPSCTRDPYIAPSSRDIPDPERELFVINGLAETISLIEPESRAMYHDVLRTGQWPNHLLYYEGKLYLVNSGDNNIVVYDENSFEERGEIYLGAGSNPWMIIRAGSGSTGYVPNFVAGEVAVVDLVGLKVLGRIPVGTGPEGGAYQNGKVYVCNTAWDYQLFDFREGTVSVIDTGSNEVTATISVGKNPQAAIPFPDLNEVHIVCTGKNGGDDADDGAVYIVDSDTDEVKEIIKVGGSPSWSEGAVDRTNKIVYLTGIGGLQSYNYSTREVFHGSNDYILAGDNAESDFFSGVVVDEMFRVLYVCFFSADKIIVLDLDSYEVIEEIEGSDGVQSIFLLEE